MIADVNEKLLQEAKEEIKQKNPKSQVLAVKVDVRSQESIQAMVDETIKTFGRLDYCANVAGVIKFGDSSILPVEDFDFVLQVNLRGVFLCAKAQISAMLKQEPLTHP